nr:N-acetylmuramoyl-L-alanine amidase [uncultured Flavobacterium sp.]
MLLNKVRMALGAVILFVGTTNYAQNFKVVLDAGHGGKDFGAVRNNYIEKKIVLDVTLKVGKILEKDKTIDVVYTRDTDVFVELRERSNIANRVKGDIFVSIHANAVKNAPEAYGTETFIMGISKNKSNLEVAKNENAVITLEQDYKTVYAGYDPSNPESIIGLTLIQEQYVLQSADLANRIQTKFDVDAKRKNRGVKQGPFWVLHGAFMPSVLVEVGFVSNSDEGEYINSEEGKNELAIAIANAIKEYKNTYYTSSKNPATTGSSSQTSKPEVISKSEVKTAPVVKKEEVKVDVKTVENSAPAKELIVTKQEQGTVFMIQIAASSKNIATTPQNFNGLDNVTMKEEDNLFKYFSSSSSNYETVLATLDSVKKKYPTAYIVAYKDGVKIPLRQALR